MNTSSLASRRSARPAGPVLILAALALGLLGGQPGGMVAQAEIEQLDELPASQLASVRQQVVDRGSLRATLSRTADDLQHMIADVAQAREQNRLALVRLRDDARQLAKELDRRVPRLGLRLESLKAARRASARALVAPSGTGGQSVSMAAATRARLLASDPPLLERMRKVTASMRRLSRPSADLLAQQDQLLFRLPLLQATEDRLAHDAQLAEQRRAATGRRLQHLDAELARLAGAERALQAAVSETSAGRPPMPPASRPAGVASAAPPAAAAKPALVAGWAYGHDGRGPLSTAPDRPLAGPGAYEVALLEAAPPSGGDGRGTLARLQGEEPPLVPDRINLGEALVGAEHALGQTAVAIPAAAHQRVAAPADGKVVFAGTFRSYGLLLIIEHDSEYHTLLWGFATLNVAAGEQVHGGQIVGMVDAKAAPKLFVELRRNGRPVSPQAWLAASSSGIKG